MGKEFDAYKTRAIEIIQRTLKDMECQPIFFVGTGFSKRYFGAPTWVELLTAVALRIGISEGDFNYILQKNNQDLIHTGDALSDKVFEWAWSKGKNQFPKEYFEGARPKSLFLKYMACQELKSIILAKYGNGNKEHHKEIDILKKTKPHAIITTNYDSLADELFPDYEAVIGESVIRRDMNVIGEIFKIHGSVDDPKTIVLTGVDYSEYRKKKRYISAKLLTYLAEHPVFIFGYGLGDPNVTEIIQDIGYIIGSEQIIKHIFYVEWKPDAEDQVDLREEYVIGSQEEQYRVRAITTNNFDWIYEAISQQSPLEWVNPKLLRALSARFYKLIRSDIPCGDVEVNYDHLVSIANTDNELPKLLGISYAESPNISHPFTLTDIAKKLGYNTWHKADDLIKKIEEETGISIKESDNRYHYCLIGKSKPRRYSEEMFQLLKLVKDGLPYEVTL